LIVVGQLDDFRLRPFPWRRAAACNEYIDRALMLDARVQVRRKRAILTEELLAHAPDGRRSVNLELGYTVRTLIPAREE